MRILKITNGPLNQNCYIIYEGERAIVIDPGIETDKILYALREYNIKPEVVLLTHGHFDHTYSVKTLKNLGAKVYISEKDGPKLLDSEINMGFLYDIECEPALPDGFLKEGVNEFLGQKFEVIFTPGHTSGSVVIIYNDFIFTGDTYFEEGVYGRTDLFDGNQSEIEKSIIKLRPYLENKTICAGHE